MRKNLLKQLTLALLMTVAVPTLTAQVHVGDILCEGNAIISPANYSSSGATAIGVVFYVDNTGQHGWAVALQDAGSYKWGGRNSDTPLPNYTNPRQAIYDLDGYYNTLVVRQHSTDHPAFYAVDFENGWYVPSIGQFNFLYGNLIEVNASLRIADGLVFESSTWRYWSSTEYGSNGAWRLGGTGGVFTYSNNEITNDGKDISLRIRAVRNF